MGGIVGMIMTGFFADLRVNNAGANGVFYGNGKLLGHQVAAFVCVFVCVFIVSWILCKLTNLVIPLRVSEEQERDGLDISQHGESASIVDLGLELTNIMKSAESRQSLNP